MSITYPEEITVIIRDNSPIWKADSPPKLRTVNLALTQEQRQALKTENSDSIDEYIEQAIIE